MVKGEYSLKEADGTTRIVKYTSDKKNGFNAVVIREGHAAHPQGEHKKIVVPVVQHHDDRSDFSHSSLAILSPFLMTYVLYIIYHMVYLAKIIAVNYI